MPARLRGRVTSPALGISTGRGADRGQPQNMTVMAALVASGDAPRGSWRWLNMANAVDQRVLSLGLRTFLALLQQMEHQVMASLRTSS